MFPVEVAPLGLEIFDAPPDRYRELEGFSLVHYAFEPGVWREFLWRPFLDFMSFVAVYLWAAMPARRRARVAGEGARPRERGQGRRRCSPSRR